MIQRFAQAAAAPRLLALLPIVTVAASFLALAFVDGTGIWAALVVMLVLAAVILPGMLVVLTVFGQLSLPLALALGSGIGLSAFIFAFILLAMMGAQHWFAAWLPVWVVLSAIAWFAGGSVRLAATPPLVARSLAALMVAAMVFVAATNFPFHPLPERIGSEGATYYFDLPWHMAIAGMLKEQWPAANPVAAGLRLYYHIGSHVLFAGLSAASGASIPAVMLCFGPLLIAAQLALQIYCLGWQVLSARAGAVAVILVLFAGGADLVLFSPEPYFYSNFLFLNTYSSDIFVSPSFALATVLLVSALSLFLLIQREPAGTLSRQAAAYVILGVILLGVAISKGGVVLTFSMGAALAFIIRGVAGRWIFSLLLVAVMCVAAQIVVTPISVPFTGGGLELRFGDFLLTVPALGFALDFSARHPNLFPFLLTPIWLAGYAPAVLLGVLAGLTISFRKFFEDYALFLAMGIVGVGAVLLLFQGSGAQIYIFQGAFPAVAVAAGAGLTILWGRFGRVARGVVLAVFAVAIGSRAIDLYPAYHKLQGARLQSQERLTPDIVSALDWLKANTRAGEPFGINQQMIRRPERDDIEQLRNNDYAGLAERPALAGGLDYAGWEMHDGNLQRPFVFGHGLTEIESLQSSFYREGNIDAGEKLRSITGVRYFFLDKRTSFAPILMSSPKLTVKFENGDAAILALSPNLSEN